MDFIPSIVGAAVEQVWLAWLHNWPYLALSVVIATLLKLYVDTERVTALLQRHRRGGVIAATAAAVGTPFCSCGTTAVLLGMMASRMPWAPIVAFMVASPLTSPEGLVYSAGLFGWPFALAFYLASIGLGLAGGWIAAVLEGQGWLAGQTRFAEPATVSCARPAAATSVAATCCAAGAAAPALQLSGWGGAGAVSIPLLARCGCDQAAPPRNAGATGHESAGGSCRPTESAGSPAPGKPPVTAGTLVNELYRGGKQLAVMFTGFAFIGYLLNGLIPASWVALIFGGGNLHTVPLAATLGLPLYINAEASLPLIRALMDNGMSQGAALAFLIAGAGTSIGAITGALTIARWRVIGLVVGTLWAGAMLSGYAFDLVLMMGAF